MARRLGLDQTVLMLAQRATHRLTVLKLSSPYSLVYTLVGYPLENQKQEAFVLLSLFSQSSVYIGCTR